MTADGGVDDTWEGLREATIRAQLTIGVGDVPFVEIFALNRLIGCLDTFDKSAPYTLDDGLALSLMCARGLIDAATGVREARPTGNDDIDRYRNELVLGCRAFGNHPDGFERFMATMRRAALSALEDFRGNHDMQIQWVHRSFHVFLALGPHPTVPFPEWISAAAALSLPRSLGDVQEGRASGGEAPATPP
jgi:hypothetical protein